MNSNKRKIMLRPVLIRIVIKGRIVMAVINQTKMYKKKLVIIKLMIK